MESIKIKIDLLEPNMGQIPGLPINPRQWTKGDVDRIAASLQETPELFDLRPCIVLPYDGKYVILGGNLRFEGAKKNDNKEVPCLILPPETPVEKLKEIVIKDNGTFGAWDADALANEWSDLALVDWGVPSYVTGFADTFDPASLSIPVGAPAGESKTGLEQMTFIFTQEDAQVVKDYIKAHSKEEIVAHIVELCHGAEAK